MDRLQAMQLFVQIADSGSFTRAAEALGLSRPAASNAIRALEDRLGTRLLSRTTRQVQLTADGQAYRERCQRLLADMAEAEALFRPQGSQLRGRLRIDVPSRVAAGLMAPALPDFLEHHPELSLELGSSDRAIDLFQDGVDAVIRVGASSDERLISRPLGQFRVGSYASPAYLARHGRPERLEALSGHWLVDYAPPQAPASEQLGLAAWEHLAANGSRQRLMLRSRLRVNSVETYLAAGLAGLGLIQVPAYDVAGALARGELVELMQAWPAPPLPVALLYPQRRHLSRRLQAFAAWCETLFRPHLLPI
ncbi:LysR family transcriptional regulator [Paucibacter sp. APW11]|uniref:LysR family transcriptional regulator n=1 Tax=Roseateles aquae TaxID=3077235 RepID=A0ABU3PD86_9BURK|nr:LysR family transcriptional regulator [Paucibacter sp. APW11]MDT9000073.1 LysR family transcriptional regulator [Paucibacter sp. APW11]